MSGLYFLDLEPLKVVKAVNLVVEQAIETSDGKATKTALSYTFAQTLFTHASEITLMLMCKSLALSNWLANMKCAMDANDLDRKPKRCPNYQQLKHQSIQSSQQMLIYTSGPYHWSPMIGH
jgi:hypothetical protein